MKYNYLETIKNEFDNSLKFSDLVFQNKKKGQEYYYCIFKNKKIIFKNIMYKNIFEEKMGHHYLAEYDNIDKTDIFLNYKFLPKTLDECKTILSDINNCDYIQYSKLLDDFFNNSYKLLSGFPPLFSNTENLLIFDYIEGKDLKLNELDANLPELFKLCYNNFKTCKLNNIYIDYTYNASDIVLGNDNKLYFVDIENFCPTVKTDWYFIEQYNEDSTFFNTINFKKEYINDQLNGF